MRVLVCGGRDFTDANLMSERLNDLHGRKRISAIIQGGAKGADYLAKIWAHSWAIPITTFHADWKLHGKAAGPIRNKAMLEIGKPDLVVAFPGGRGTADMVKRAKAAGVEVIEISTGG